MLSGLEIKFRYLGIVVGVLAFSWTLATQENVLAQQPAQVDPSKTERDGAMYPLMNSTLGGKQLWTDYAWRRGWRIQRNAITGHWRLLDDKNVRHASGSREDCQRALDQEQPDSSLPSQEAVVLLHGLGRSSASMRGLGEYLKNANQLTPIYFEYASTRSSISDHADAFADFVDSLPGDLRLHFVGHSMGNIVVRHWIGDLQRAARQPILDRIQAVVMLGPPNQGASIARQLAKTGVFGWIAGEGGMELGPGWSEFQKRLATPPCPFGIIAGKLPESVLDNPLVSGAGDFVVSVEETQLEGATDVLVVPRIHSFLMDAPEVQAATARFLETRSQFTPK